MTDYTGLADNPLERDRRRCHHRRRDRAQQAAAALITQTVNHE